MIKKFVAFLTAGWLLGLISLTLVYLLPTERMEQNVKSSMDIFYTESVYPQQVSGYKATQLDNETDAIMLLGAIYDGGNYSAIKQAMRAARVDISDVPSKCNVLIKYAWENQEPDSVSEYSRYWHGYMLWLKPLLLFFDYADIRMLNNDVSDGIAALAGERADGEKNDKASDSFDACCYGYQSGSSSHVHAVLKYI